ncbi:MAG: DegT/DnrJ/EryC1/StrS family aminotransferase [Anaerolineae bacterium]|nr:DegT/DnrJ/EryC1/StrS family aminotransferase [Anaerolineae bacterium]
MNQRHMLAIRGGEPVIRPGTIQPWPPIDEVDRQMVLASLESRQHTFGPNCVAFEREFAAWNGNRYAITTNSGTAALHMAVYACGCGAGDQVIAPAYSWSSSATCVLQHNAVPVFVDIDWKTMNIDVTQIEAAITPKTKAVLVVHLHGLSVDMDAVLDIARRHGLKVIEDACQAHGAEYRGRKVGTWGDCATFSFNQNKSLCSGEGGMFVTDDEALFERAKMLWSFGETRTPVESRDYHVYAMGWMYRNNDLTAAFGRAQLTRLDGYLAQQIENAGVLHQALQGTPGLILPAVPGKPGEFEGFKHNWYNYVIRFDVDALGHARDPRAFRDALVKAINAEGVPLTVWQQFILPAMTVFQAKNGYGQGCPWTCPYGQEVDYPLDRYPVAQKHCDTHACLVMALRAPNGPEVARLLAQGIRKVMENVDQVSNFSPIRGDGRHAVDPG